MTSLAAANGPTTPDPIELRTQQLILLPLAPAAAARLPRDRDAASHFIDATLDPEWPLADVLGLMPVHARATVEAARFGIWIVIEAATNTVVGDVGFVGEPSGEGIVEIGYSIVPSRRGRGYATEAAAALANWALDQPGVTAVIAETDLDNTASYRVLERAGFERTSTTTESVHWRRERGTLLA